MSQLRINPKLIAKQIWESGELRIDLREWCVKELKKLWLSDLEVYDELDNTLHKVSNSLKNLIQGYIKRGVTPHYEFNDIFPYLLHRIKDVQFLKALKSGIRNIGWRDFEYLCKYYLKINGIENVEVTRGKKEGGVDFYGLLRIDKYIQGAFYKGLGVRILGQARHSSAGRKVEESELRVFVTQYEDFKEGKGMGVRVVPDWFKNLNTPLIAIFITNTEFTIGAHSMMREKGIIPKEGDHIAEDLIHCPDSTTWFSVNEKGNIILNQEAFISSIKKVCER